MTTHPNHMSHEDLLEAFGDQYAWVAEMRSAHFPSPEDIRSLHNLQAEILRRMGVPNEA